MSDIDKRAAALDAVNFAIRWGQPKPTFLPLMRRPCRSVEKESAESCMRALLERTCAELRLKNDG